MRAEAAGLPFNERPLWMAFGVAGGATAVEGAGAAYTHFTVGLRFIPVVPEISWREGIGGQPHRHLTSIAAGGRFLLPAPPGLNPNFRFAFSHQHELPFDEFLDQPFAAIFGTHKQISHRTGFEAGAGLELCLDPKGVLGIWAQATVLVFPGTAGPPATVIGEGGLSVAVGPRRP
jgi:hypothetical protein